MNCDTLEAIRRSAAIPSMPVVATRCFEMTQDPNCHYDKLVDLLATDPGIAAEVLRLSNSPLFGVMRRITSLKQAIGLLGLKRLRDLVLTRYLIQRLDENRSDLLDISYFWRRSLTTAVVAGRLAESILPAQRDECFMAGLLADVGVPVLARALPSVYAPIASAYKPQGGDDWRSAEHVALKVSHAVVSALVLEEWRLPESLVSAVCLHHTPTTDFPADAAGREQAPVVSAAGEIARILCDAGQPPTAAQQCVAAMESAQLDCGLLTPVLPLVESDVESLASMLRVDVIPNRIFKLIAEQIAANLTLATA